ncbi:MAG: hypothetical protein AB7U82_18395 [Blastocatellales bacterium]
MFCPKCGSNQGEGKRFCTVCGTNLAAVSQALTGQLPQPNYYAPPIPHPLEIERQRDMGKGVRLSIIGGGVVAFNFFDFIFTGDSFFEFWTFIGFILLAIGISKIITSRPPSAANAHNTPAPAPQAQREMQLINQVNPQPVFSAAPVVESAARTSELEPVRQPSISVTEDDTRHLPHNSPPHNLSR